MFSRGERHLLPSGSSASARGGKSRGRGDRGRGRGGRGGGGRGGRTAGFSSSDSISKSDSEGGSHNLPITAAQAESQATVEESKGVAVILSSSASFCDFHTWIYSIELNGDSDSEILPLEPIICFGNELPLAMTFVNVNSTLYMFGGFNPDNDPPIRWESRMYTYPLDSALLSNPSPSPNRNCNPKLIQNGPSMKTPKVAPMSIVVCGKICVYSQSLSDARKPNFEVYDPATNLWSELPEPSEYHYSPYELSSYLSLSLPVEDRPSRSILVEGVFVRNSTLYISISSISSASYAFDFDPSSSCTAWQPVSFAGRRPSSRMRGIVVDDYYLSPYIGFNLTATEGLQHSFYLTPSGDPRNSLAAVCGHTDMLDLGKGADGDSRICIFTAGFKEYPIGKDGDVPHLLVDIFQCLTSESRQLKVIQKKCFTFLLTTKIRCETIDFAVVAFIQESCKNLSYETATNTAISSDLEQSISLMEDMIWFCLLRLSGNRGYMLICVLDLMFMQVEFQLNFLDSRISKQVFIKSPDAAQYPTVCEVVQHLDLYSSMCLLISLVSALLLISKLVEMILLCCYSSPIC